MRSIFLDKSIKPHQKILADALGRSFNYWEEIKETLESQYGNLTEEWKYYSASSGWTLKLLLKKRNLLFLVPCARYFTLVFVFGDKAVNEIKNSSIPENILEELSNAKRYVEGRGLRITVKKKADIKNIIMLVAIKVHN